MLYTEVLRKDWAKSDIKSQQAYDSYERLLKAISQKEIPENIQKIVEAEIAEINDFEEGQGSLFVFIKKSQVTLLSVLETELKLVAKNHYRNHWMLYGALLYGMPIGVAIAVTTKNYAFMGICMAIGLPFGMTIGKKKDEQAALEGKQLDYER